MLRPLLRPDWAPILNLCDYLPCRSVIESSVTLTACRYDAIIDLTRKLNQQHATPAEVQNTTRYILKSLFPGWLPGAFKVRMGLAALLIAARRMSQMQ